MCLVKTVVYDLFKRLLGSGPVYAVLGNHETYNEYAPHPSSQTRLHALHRRAQDAPHSLNGALAEQFSWYAPLPLIAAFVQRPHQSHLNRL